MEASGRSASSRTASPRALVVLLVAIRFGGCDAMRADGRGGLNYNLSASASATPSMVSRYLDRPRGPAPFVASFTDMWSFPVMEPTSQWGFSSEVAALMSRFAATLNEAFFLSNSLFCNNYEGKCELRGEF